MIRYAHSPWVAFTVEAIWGSILHVARQQTGPLCATGSKRIRSRARTGTADAPCFQRVVSLFSLCYLLLEKSSKSLIRLSDCPFVSIASLFFLEISLFPGEINRVGRNSWTAVSNVSAFFAPI